MSGSHIFTIDLGTSGPKVALFTTSGSFVDGEFEPVDLVLSGGGGVEQRVEDWWDGIVACSKRLWSRIAVTADDIAAVSVTSQWSGTVAVGADGSALHNALIWMDSRGAGATADMVSGLVKVAGYEPTKLAKWVRYTGGIPSRSGKDPICHILYIEQNLPEVAAETDLYLEPKDYLNLLLTGRAVATYDSIVLHWVTDNRDMSSIDYVPELVEMAGLNRDKLPDLIAATDLVGGVTDAAAGELGLRAGTPVIGGTPDVQSAAVGSGAVEDYAGHLYVGTSSWLTCHVPKKKTDVLKGIASLPSPLPGRYFIANEQETAGACLNWLRDNVLYSGDETSTEAVPDDVFERIDRLASSVPAGANGVIFTPWLNGERTPVDDHTIRAGWHNLSLANDRGDMVRAVLEGVALNSRWLLEAVEKFAGRPFDGLNFIGGGAQSPLWCQIHADVLDREIRQVAHPIRANARGAALLAAVAIGELGLDEVSGSVEITETFTPDPSNRAVYDQHFAAFRKIYSHNKGIHRRLNRHGR